MELVKVCWFIHGLSNFSDIILPEVSQAMDSSGKSYNTLPLLEGLSSDTSAPEGSLYVHMYMCILYIKMSF
jgi:hypothetical protein